VQAVRFPFLEVDPIRLRPRQPDPVLKKLQRGSRIDSPAIILVAHPDDETIGMGARLRMFTQLMLVHLTDGAPLAQDDDGTQADEHRQVRAAELEEALACLGVVSRRLHLNQRDQGAAFEMVQTARILRVLLRHFKLVITHAYEGGHPDHDAAALAVQAACRLIAREGGRSPVRIEFAGYHLAAGQRVTGRFWHGPDCPSVHAAISPRQLDRKRAALSCFRSQADVVAWFAPEQESYRRAPDYIFTDAPPPGAALYDDWGWTLTSERWRKLAASALKELGLVGPL
jgi:LmbE family N-acetylglucosaminyl deacetylase